MRRVIFMCVMFDLFILLDEDHITSFEAFLESSLHLTEKVRCVMPCSM